MGPNFASNHDQIQAIALTSATDTSLHDIQFLALCLLNQLPYRLQLGSAVLADHLREWPGLANDVHSRHSPPRLAGHHLVDVG